MGREWPSPLPHWAFGSANLAEMRRELGPAPGSTLVFSETRRLLGLPAWRPPNILSCGLLGVLAQLCFKKKRAIAQLFRISFFGSSWQKYRKVHEFRTRRNVQYLGCNFQGQPVLIRQYQFFLFSPSKRKVYQSEPTGTGFFLSLSLHSEENNLYQCVSRQQTAEHFKLKATPVP